MFGEVAPGFGERIDQRDCMATIEVERLPI